MRSLHFTFFRKFYGTLLNILQSTSGNKNQRCMSLYAFDLTQCLSAIPAAQAMLVCSTRTVQRRGGERCKRQRRQYLFKMPMCWSSDAGGFRTNGSSHEPIAQPSV